MEHFPGTLTRSESDALAADIQADLAENGFGLWAVEVPGAAPFIGYVGLAVPRFEARFTPCVEIGWRLAAGHWGQGYATEAASAALDHAFGVVGLDEVVSFTIPANRRSLAVMERLGMTRSPAEGFEHPGLPEGHPMRPHLLYRMPRAKWPAIIPCSGCAPASGR